MQEESNVPLTEEAAEEMLRSFSQKSANTHTFFTDVIKAKSTTKTGNLSIDELGMPRLTQRGIKELELFCHDTFKDTGWESYFRDLAEIQTATSLSKDGILIKLVVTTKKELADVTPEKKKNKGMFGFGKKEKEENP
jgi:hypothetical protein